MRNRRVSTGLPVPLPATTGWPLNLSRGGVVLAVELSVSAGHGTGLGGAGRRQPRADQAFGTDAEFLGRCWSKLVSAAFASDELSVVNGDAETGKAFVGCPSITCSSPAPPSVGRQVAQAAAANLTP